MRWIGLNRAKLKQLGSFSAGFIIERILTGFLPLCLLYLTSEAVYTRLEFIFSLATVMVPASDLVARMFFLYGYSNSSDRDKYLRLSMSVFTCQVGLILLGALVCLLINETNLLFAFMRLAYISLYFFVFDYLRLENRQGLVIRDSILINLSLLATTFVGQYLLASAEFIFPLMAAVQLVYVVFRLKSLRNLIQKWPWTEITQFLKQSVRYSFPVFVNVTIAIFIQNYLKVHFYRAEDQQSMFIVSLLLRLGLSVQIIHSLVQAYFTKKIFLKELQFRRFFSNIYLPLLLFAAMGLSIAELIYFAYIDPEAGIYSSVILLVNLYFLFWCTSAILEMLFTSQNKNMWLLGINVLSLGLTLLVFILIRQYWSGNLNTMVALMSCQPALFILFVAFFHKRAFKKNC
jgi:hypothetical protein